MEGDNSLEKRLLDGPNRVSYTVDQKISDVQQPDIRIKQTRSRLFLNEENHGTSSKSRRREITTVEFYKQENWFEEFCEILFKIKERNTTIRLEIYYGLIHFISCCYILVVAPQQLAKAGYNENYTVVAVGACCGIGSIVGGLLTNLPFVIAPTSVVSIFLSIYLQSSNINSNRGSAAVILSGISLMFLFWKPLGIFVGKLIPLPIQVGTTLGVGLLTCLAGAAEINIVQPGKYALLKLGPITTEVVISLFGLLAIGTALAYHIKGAFIIGLVSCSIIWWASQDAWPSGILSTPSVTVIEREGFEKNTFELIFELVFLYILYLSGLIPTFTELGGLQREDGTTPRGRWFFVIAGIMTIISGIIKSAPILISPESSAGIKAGAKTGLSTFVCGLFFIMTIFFSPLFKAVPSAATSPLLVMIGVILFQDVNRINWKDIEDALPAFVVLFFIPFTYSIINGVTVGYIAYIVMGLLTGTLKKRAEEFLEFYNVLPSSNRFDHGIYKDIDGVSVDVEPYQAPTTDALVSKSTLSLETPYNDEAAINLLEAGPNELSQTPRSPDPPGRMFRSHSTRDRRNSATFTYDREAIRSIEYVEQLG